ncbi:hypothetical protein [Marinobacter sp. OP 3.4]|uniref:hypothetical protein n=1 Tax=Marinobacter sp. OP 3.4 TaxID=3076501 RepID=UPI002E2113E3
MSYTANLNTQTQGLAMASPFGGGNTFSPSYNPTTIETTETGDQSGSENIAKIHRAQWDDYIARFAPVEDMLFDRFNDSEFKQGAVDFADQTMTGAMNRSFDQTQRGLSRYGVTPTGDVAEANNRTWGLKTAAARAGSKNAMRTAIEDQEMGLMTGGLSTVAQQREDAWRG